MAGCRSMLCKYDAIKVIANGSKRQVPEVPSSLRHFKYGGLE
jgi:hypothetical protein